MKKIKDRKRIETLIRESDFQSYFSHDITAMTELISAKAGEMLISEGVTSDYLFFIIDGQCRYFSMTLSGSYVTFGSSRNQRFFGEASSLWAEKPTSSVQAVSDTTCLVINLNKYRHILQNDIRFLQHTCHTLSAMVNNLDKTMSAYVGSNLRDRLASFILQNSVDGRFTISLVSTSESLGTSYRHLQRIMKSFCEEGLLVKEKRAYHITDSKKMQSIASDTYVYFY